MKKLKTEYIRLADGTRHAPYRATVSFYHHTPGIDLEERITALAGRNKGKLTGSGTSLMSGERDLSFDFFSLSGLKTFTRKVYGRYNRFDVTVERYQYTLQEEEIYD